jgi:hypothetical protein
MPIVIQKFGSRCNFSILESDNKFLMLIMPSSKIERNIIVDSECNMLKKDSSDVFVFINVRVVEKIKKINVTCFILFRLLFFSLTLKYVK